MINKIISTILLLSAAALNAAADGGKTFSYAADNAYTYQWGTGRAETYNIAILLNDRSLVGSRITGVTVPLSSVNLSGLKVWLSKELRLKTVDDVRVNDPDILSQDAEITAKTVRVDFAEPYTLTEDGVYVGYSVTVDNLDNLTRNPIIVAEQVSDGGLFINTSVTYMNWKDYSAKNKAVSALQVHLEGDFSAAAAGVSKTSEVLAKPGEAATAAIDIVNHGTEPIESVDYTVEVGGASAGSHVTLKKPVAPGFGSTGQIEIGIPAVGESGTYDYTVTLTRVNGVDNRDKSAASTGVLNVIPFVPVHRAVMEEYTGFWCGWCPRGLAGLERMAATYPDEFIGLSYHNRDVLTYTSNYAVSVGGFPVAWFDRAVSADPYEGFKSGNQWGAEEIWLQRRDVFAIAAVSLESQWTDDTQTAIAVTGTVNFVKTGDVDCSLVYVLLADDLHNDSWYQTNNLGAMINPIGDPFFDRYAIGGEYASGYGIHFNDVVICASELKGIEGSVPRKVRMNEPLTHEYTFELSKAVNTYGSPIYQDKSKLRVVAMLVDNTTGEIINANMAPVGQKSPNDKVSSIGGTYAGGTDAILSVTYRDLSGRIVTAPSKGVYIRSVTYRNGRTSSSKVAVR